jgi:hypothetical protein
MTDLNELQLLMESTYGQRDRARGMTATVAWLARRWESWPRPFASAVATSRSASSATRRRWLASLANQLGISLDDAIARYLPGCPRCAAVPCQCPW